MRGILDALQGCRGVAGAEPPFDVAVASHYRADSLGAGVLAARGTPGSAALFQAFRSWLVNYLWWCTWHCAM